MKRELGSGIECFAKVEGFEPESRDPDSHPPEESSASDWIGRRYAKRVRASEKNGFSVYTRSKRFKNQNGDNVGCSDKPVECSSGTSNKAGGGMANSNGEARRESDEIELKKNPAAPVLRSNVGRRFTRSALKSKDEDSTAVNGVAEHLGDGDVLEAEGLESQKKETLSPSIKKQMKMSKKIEVKGRPTTVRELFETGLLEGYPVFYNGGKRGFPLRGTIKDAGIICTCNLCNGVKVVPPCQFEIHASKSYRRASQYICLDNGKSLLDVVKECQKASLKTLEEIIQNFVGPMPMKESVVCRTCGGSFLGVSAAEVDQFCNSCLIIANSDADLGCVKSGSLDIDRDLMISGSSEKHIAPQSFSLRGRKKKKNLKLGSNIKHPSRFSVPISSRKRGKWKSVKRPSQSASTSKFPASSHAKFLKLMSDLNTDDSASLTDSAKNKIKGKISRKPVSSNVDSLSESLETGSASVSVKSKNSWKITKKDQRMHKLVFEDGGLPDGTEVAYYSHGKRLRVGYKMGSGIVCSCCKSQVSPSQFEAHAGWASRRKPYMYIYTSNGVSLHEFAISLLKNRKGIAKENDDLCIICADGGKLMLCDGCPRAFHKECASISNIPRGKWYCTYCENMFQREKFVECNANAVAAGRISGVDPIAQITNRCIRIVKGPEEDELIACAICRGYDFSQSGFGPHTVILCDQCEKEYHVGCLKKGKIADLKELPKGKWFCSVNCKKIYSALQNLLNSGEEKIPETSLVVVRKKLEEKNCITDGVGLDVRWRLLNGKNTSRETRFLLSQAVSIFHECFAPIVDSETGRDFIPSMVYGRNIRGQDFSGMHCAILTVNSTVVSAGILRIFGQEMAELPLAATRMDNQGKGYFQILFTCIEKLLAFLNVKLCVLPAADEAKLIWTKKFGFATIPQEQLLIYKKVCWQMTTFKGTSMLEKPVPKCRIIKQDKTKPDARL